MLSPLLIAGCLLAPAQVIDLGPDAETDADEAAVEDISEQLDEYVPTAPDPATGAAQPARAASLPAAAETLPAAAGTLPASTAAPSASSPAPEIALIEESDEGETEATPCPTAERARYLVYGGAGAGGVGLLGGIAFFAVGLVERLRAQELLDNSPAFGKQGDQYVVNDPGHADVDAYASHRATASVMTQLVWISLGVAAVGSSVAIASYWLGEDAGRCQSRED
ncbi:MAG: hypothetical protein JXR83_22310 [Deltaproteobacteria bacterium]|nr:hypothetical protein [Deltaproteobacteria bacterium]